MINAGEKLHVIAKAREWAAAERRLRASGLCYGEEKEWVSRESDRTEEALLEAVNELEAKERRSEVLTFFGKTIQVGDRIDETLFQWLKMEARKWGGR